MTPDKTQEKLEQLKEENRRLRQELFQHKTKKITDKGKIFFRKMVFTSSSFIFGRGLRRSLSRLYDELPNRVRKDTMAEVVHERSTKCKCWRLPASYLNAKGRKLKTCTQCRDRAAQYRARYTCEHGISKYRCKPCGGTSMCEHNTQRSRCKECGGSSICEHNKRRTQCKACVGGSICEHGRVRYH